MMSTCRYPASVCPVSGTPAENGKPQKAQSPGIRGWRLTPLPQHRLNESLQVSQIKALADSCFSGIHQGIQIPRCWGCFGYFSTSGAGFGLVPLLLAVIGLDVAQGTDGVEHLLCVPGRPAPAPRAWQHGYCLMAVPGRALGRSSELRSQPCRCSENYPTLARVLIPKLGALAHGGASEETVFPSRVGVFTRPGRQHSAGHRL